MKEIMVIKDEEAIDEWNRTIAPFIDPDNEIYKAEFLRLPETFEELSNMLWLNLKNLGVLFYNLRTDCNGGFWFKGVLFQRNYTLSIEDEDGHICVIMTGISYPLMWLLIKTQISKEFFK